MKEDFCDQDGDTDGGEDEEEQEGCLEMLEGKRTVSAALHLLRLPTAAQQLVSLLLSVLILVTVIEVVTVIVEVGGGLGCSEVT